MLIAVTVVTRMAAPTATLTRLTKQQEQARLAIADVQETDGAVPYVHSRSPPAQHAGVSRSANAAFLLLQLLSSWLRLRLHVCSTRLPIPALQTRFACASWVCRLRDWAAQCCP
jgi:hypothetical protein